MADHVPMRAHPGVCEACYASATSAWQNVAWPCPHTQEPVPRDLAAALDALTARVTSIDGQVMRESASLAVLVERVAQIAKALEAVEATVYATADDVPVGPRLCPDCFVAVGPGHVCPPRETDRLRALAEAVVEGGVLARRDAIDALRAYLRETAR